MKKSVLLLLVVFTSTAAFAQKIAEKFDEEVSIKLEEGTLMGSLMVPKTKKKVPVVLIIPGSGPTDRNCNSALGLTSNSFIYLAEGLYKKKVASLRVDKRISGESANTFGANLLSVSFNDFISDTEKWIEFLKKDGRFSEIIVAGHSQGSLVGMLATKNKQADRYISLAGAGRSIDSILYDQMVVQMPQIADSLRMFIDSIKMGGYMTNAPRVLTQSFPANLKDFLFQWMSYDPSNIIASLTIPSLIINGDNDIQVPETEARLLHHANPKSHLVIIPEMNHILKDSPRDRLGNYSSYNQPELPLNKQLIKEMIVFIKK